MGKDSNYNDSVQIGQQIIFKYIKEVMKDRKITQNELAERLRVVPSTLIRNFKGETAMDLPTFLTICAILELRPYLIPSELDDTPMERIFFN